MLTQLFSLPIRCNLVVCFTEDPSPKTGQPRKSHPQDQRLPSDARMSPCLSPRLTAGLALPTGNFNAPRFEVPIGSTMIQATPPTNRSPAAAITRICNLLRGITAIDLSRIVAVQNSPHPSPLPVRGREGWGEGNFGLQQYGLS